MNGAPKRALPPEVYVASVAICLFAGFLSLIAVLDAIALDRRRRLPDKAVVDAAVAEAKAAERELVKLREDFTARGATIRALEDGIHRAEERGQELAAELERVEQERGALRERVAELLDARRREDDVAES